MADEKSCGCKVIYSSLHCNYVATIRITTEDYYSETMICPKCKGLFVNGSENTEETLKVTGYNDCGWFE
jgi:hypothetical protein